MIDVAAESQTPMISMAASAAIVEPVDAKRRWIFKTPQNDIMMSLAIATHMAAAGVKTVGFIGFSDAYGEGWYREFSKIAPVKGLTIVANERYARTDTSVTGQVLKLVAAKPDAILIAGVGNAGRAAAAHAQGARLRRQVLPDARRRQQRLPARRRQGRRRHATCRPGPVLVAAQLPASNPVRTSALDYVSKYEAAYGKGSVSTFGAHAWDAGRLMAIAAAAGAEEGAAGHAGVPRRAARRARVGARGARRARHLQHVADRPPRPRPARARDGQDRERRLASTEP